MGVVEHLDVAWIVTWLWQGCGLVAIMAIALRGAPTLNATTRHLLWWTTLLGVLGLGIVAAGLDGPPAAAHTGPDERATTAWRLPEPPVTPLTLRLPAPPEWLLPVAGGAWALWIAVQLLSFARAVGNLLRVRRGCASVPSRIERRLPEWRAIRTRGRRTRLCLSPHVPTASLLGLAPPLIALSPDLVTTLGRRDLDRVILHEYAHAQRGDDWTGAALTLVDAMVGWHPAVWWLGRRIRLEREVACDDWVVGRLADPRGYAWCLAALAERGHRRPGPHLAPSVLNRRGLLSDRVDRLLDVRRSTAIRAIPVVVVAGVGTMLLLLAAFHRMPDVITLSPDGPPRLSASVLDLEVRGPVLLARTTPPRLTTSDGGVGVGPTPTREADAQRPTPPATRDAEYGARIASPGGGEDSNRPPTAPGEAAAPIADDLRPVPRLVATRLSVGALQPPAAATRSTTRVSPDHGAADDRGGPWARVARAGRAVGETATRTGRATATAFERVGTSIAAAFTP